MLALSVDSRHSHANWAADIGGVSYPILSDFHPRGDVAQKFGLFLDNAGICDRATVIVDLEGKVRFVKSVTPSGKRNIEELLEEAKKVDAQNAVEPKGAPQRERPAIAKDATLYVKDGCPFCRTVLRSLTNLHLENQIKVRNVTQDPSARAELDKLGGEGSKVPALVENGKAQFESADIVKKLGLARARY